MRATRLRAEPKRPGLCPISALLGYGLRPDLRPTPRNMAARQAPSKAAQSRSRPTVTGSRPMRFVARLPWIFAAKKRPAADPLIVHIASERDLARPRGSNAAARKLARKFWPGPLTIILPKTGVVPDEATAGLRRAWPSASLHPVPAPHPAGRRAPWPLPANLDGEPDDREHVRSGLGSCIRHILDGVHPTSPEFTIVDLRDPRHPGPAAAGAVTHAQIERAGDACRLVSGPRAGGGAPRRARPDGITARARPSSSTRLTAAMAVWGGSGDAAGVPLEGSRLHGNVFGLDELGRRAARRLFAVFGRRTGEPTGASTPSAPRATGSPRPCATAFCGRPPADQRRTAASSARSRSFWAGVPTVTRTHSGRL